MYRTNEIPAYEFALGSRDVEVDKDGLLPRAVRLDLYG